MKVIINSGPKLSKGWTHGARDSTKRTGRLRQKVEVVLENPEPEELRETLKEGYCWWCKRGGFKTVANHTSHAHGITAREIRDLTMVTSEDSIATPEYSAYCKTRPQTVHLSEAMGWLHRSEKPPSFTVEGLRRKRESGNRVADEFNRRGIISNPKGNPSGLRLALAKHMQLLRNPQYYKNWRKGLLLTGRDKRVMSKCPICHKEFKKYETTNRRTCGNPECIHKLRSNITREQNLSRGRLRTTVE